MFSLSQTQARKQSNLLETSKSNTQAICLVHTTDPSVPSPPNSKDAMSADRSNALILTTTKTPKNKVLREPDAPRKIRSMTNDRYDRGTCPSCCNTKGPVEVQFISR